MKTLLLLLLALSEAEGRVEGLTQDVVEEHVKKLVERMRGTLAERAKATDDLTALVDQEKSAPPVLWKLLKEEKDPRVRARLRYVAAPHFIRLLWTKTVPGDSRMMTVSGDRLILLRADQTVAAASAGTGQTLWESPKLAAWSGAPAVAGNFIYLPGGSSPLWLAQRINVETGGVSGGLYLGDPALAVDGDLVLFQRRSLARVACEDGSRKKRLWEVAAGEGAPFAIGAGRAVVSDGDANILCVGVQDGKKVWMAGADQGLNFVGIHGAVVVARTKRHRIRAYDLETGGDLWRRDISSDFSEVPAGIHEGALYLRGPRLTCIDVKSGTELWSSAPSGYKAGATLTVVGRFHAFHDAGFLVLVEARTGREVMRKDLKGLRVTALGASGSRLYLLVDGGEIQAWEICGDAP